MGTIRPKPGAKVAFGQWLVIDGQQTPPQPWTGEVVEKGSYGHYAVKRDYDGKIVSLPASGLRYRKE